MPQRAWEVRSAIDSYREPYTVFAETAGKARYQSLLNARDAGYEGVAFKHFRVRSLGVRSTPLEIVQSKVAAFNERYPVGTPVRVYPLAKGHHDSAYDTTVTEPGAFVVGGHTAAVKVPGDWIEVGHVIPLVPLAGPEKSPELEGK